MNCLILISPDRAWRLSTNSFWQTIFRGRLDARFLEGAKNALSPKTA
ncbi:hypothetical protein [Microcoleus sp. CAWBG58]|nr:hypothetical protein [Microcoleus sp. CAWBG58]